MEERNIVTVFNPETEWQGTLIVQELKDAGIEAYLANGATSAGAWGDVSPLSKLEILAPEDQEEQAKRIIEDFLSSHGGAPTEEALAQEAQEAPPPEGEEDTEK